MKHDHDTQWLEQLCEHIRANSIAPPHQHPRSRLNGWRFRVNGQPVVLLLPCRVGGSQALDIARARWRDAQPAGLTLEPAN